MKMTVTIEGPSGSGKSLFLSRMKTWLEHEMRQEGFFRATAVELLHEQAPQKAPNAEQLTASIEFVR